MCRLGLVDEIVPFNFTHNAEVEAIDLLLEVDLIAKVLQHVTADTHERVGRYLLGCGDFVADPDERLNLYRTAFNVYYDNKNVYSIPLFLFLFPVLSITVY